MCYNKIGWQSSINQNTFTSNLLHLKKKEEVGEEKNVNLSLKAGTCRVSWHIFFIFFLVISSNNTSVNKLIISLICILDVFLINFWILCDMHGSINCIKMRLTLQVSVSCHEKQRKLPRELHLQRVYVLHNFHLPAKLRLRWNTRLSL